MTGLVEFLRARLDEDEQAAVEAGGEGCIAWLTYRDGDGQMRYTTVAAGNRGFTSRDDVWIADGRELPRPSSVLVVYDTARVLREVEAKRRIIDEHTPGWHGFKLDIRVCLACAPLREDRAGAQDRFPCRTLRLLALSYADRPDYDESWRP